MPLREFTVVELGSGAALGYCGKIFADFGATVLKIEPPEGDPGRLEPPLVDAGAGRRESARFAWLNTNKSSVTADLDADAGAAHVRDLVERADVLLDARPLQLLGRGPLGHPQLRTAHPRLVIAALSWFGETGPYRDFAATDVVCRALAGLVALIGPKDRPLAICDHQADVVGGLSAFIAVASSLLGGDGQRWSVSLHEAAVALSEHHAAFGPGGSRARLGINRFATTFPTGVFRCREGWLGATANTPAQWRSFCEMLGVPELAKDPRYAAQVDRARNADALEAVFGPRLMERSAAEWFAEGLERRLPLAIVPSPAELPLQEVHRSNGVFADTRIGAARFTSPVLPLNLTRTPPRAGGIAPFAGQGDAAPRGRATNTAAQTAPTGSGDRPLAGLRIVDFSMGWAGPLATRYMADLGAEIIKIESCRYPDWWRAEREDAPENPNFLVMNRNKSAVSLDLQTRDGVALAKRLVETADAVIDNQSRNVLPRLGLGYADLCAVKPDLVMVSMAAYRKGPWEELRAYGSTLESASGLPTIAGTPDGRPMLTHFAHGDAVGGFNAAAALLIALLHRRRTGEGQHIDLSLVECMIPMVAPWVIEQAATGTLRPRDANRHPESAPHGCFRCAGEDAWVFVAVTDDPMWQRLCAAIGRPDIAADTTLARAAGRRADAGRIERILENWTQRRSADEAMNLLQRAGVAAGVARNPCDLVIDPHLLARGFWQPIDHAVHGPHVLPSLGFRHGERPVPLLRPAQTIGESNAAILGGLLGLTSSALASLAEKRIIGTARLRS